MTSAQLLLSYRCGHALPETTRAEAVSVHVSIAQSSRFRRIRLDELLRRVGAFKLEIEAASWKRRNYRMEDEDTRTAAPAAMEGGLSRWIFTTRIACPLCSSPVIHRSHRQGRLERVLSAAALPFRCDDCSARFFLFRLAHL
jgi:hypothetical protein